MSSYNPNAVESELWDIWGAAGTRVGLKIERDTAPLMILMIRNASLYILDMETTEIANATELASRNLEQIIQKLADEMRRRYKRAVDDDLFFDVLDDMNPTVPFSPLTKYRRHPTS